MTNGEGRSVCKKCGAEVFWATHHRSGKYMLMDFEPVTLWKVEKCSPEPGEEYGKKIAVPNTYFNFHMATCGKKEVEEAAPF